ncbi:FadR/GntR family transcriptional regulator [Pollutimonas sp. M17]|uniref:FadR/GntR family transcriptional regulator n=1 Tax=Pollutimonas sp. M17 TaxID=2962065 RepID=UPI0021F4F09F|nr:FCD domain-containing protein [Pollutimonas sp. M17]UYO95443.1 FCD domain-containing protein [Pollutimonas sp. M17]
MDEMLENMAVRAEGAKALARHLLEEMAAGRLREGVKLAPERELSQRFGASRGAVRRVLAELRQRGLITQAVGSGTFASAAAHTLQASGGSRGPVLDTSPAELMEARLLIEPLMPALIVRNASAADFALMQECLEKSEAALTIEEFEHWDETLHKSFAQATNNSFFLHILDLTNRVREQGEWGRLKRNSLTTERRRQYERQHRGIVEALKDRDAARARALLLEHLEQIQQNLFQA